MRIPEVRAKATAKGRAKSKAKAKGRAAAHVSAEGEAQLLCASDYNSMDITRIIVVLVSSLWSQPIQDLPDAAFSAVMRGQADKKFLETHFGITSAAKLAAMREDRLISLILALALNFVGAWRHAAC